MARPLMDDDLWQTIEPLLPKPKRRRRRHSGRRPLDNRTVMTGLLFVLKTGIDETKLASMQFAMTFPMRMQWAYLALPVGAGLMLFHLVVRLILAPATHILDVRERSE